MKNFNLVLIIALFILVSLNIFNHKEHQKEYQELKTSMEEGLTFQEAEGILNLIRKITTIIGNNKENIMENRVEINKSVTELEQLYNFTNKNLELITTNTEIIGKIADIIIDEK